MGCTARELLERISSAELTEWLAFYGLEPFGEQADYLGSAIVAMTVANVNRSKGQQAYTVDQFLPKFDKVKETQSVEEMIQLATMLTVAAGGKVEDEEKS